MSPLTIVAIGIITTAFVLFGYVIQDVSVVIVATALYFACAVADTQRRAVPSLTNPKEPTCN